MIEFVSVSKHYGDVAALRDASFAIEPGEIFGYIGPNGAGKTTTIRVLTGLVGSYEGTVRIDGKDIESARHVYHKMIGYLPQESGFQEWRTVRHTLTTFGLLSGMEKQTLQQRIGAILTRLDLTEYAERRIAILSGGTRQRVAFAQALLHDPEILILDEPLNGLDPVSRYQMKEIIRSMASARRTVLFSSHVL
ncbi:MAG: ABC transporter ATP-binding protein, partial [Spirochaetales bacterium]